METHTIKNLKEVEDSAPKFGMSDVLEARFAREELRLENSGISYQRLQPSSRLPFGHKHSEQEELYVVVGGSGRIKLDDEIVDLRQWDAVRIAPGTMRNLEAGPDGLEVVLFGAPNDANSDVEMVQGWWADCGRRKRRPYGTIFTGVPSGTRCFMNSTSRLCMRTQPCDTAWPRSSGCGVPCRPTMPPPGQSLRFGEYALVSNA
jgi:mannose-6-phosphate isomerase-like protein (cupin superfamily)